MLRLRPQDASPLKPSNLKVHYLRDPRSAEGSILCMLCSIMEPMCMEDS